MSNFVPQRIIFYRAWSFVVLVLVVVLVLDFFGHSPKRPARR
jgi:hypothetical protein